MDTFNMIFSGFGGQGALFAGKVIAYIGLTEGMEVSWLPSYGPEMRGGTANCSVCISKYKIGSPIVSKPNVLMALNLPSYNKFINLVEPGGSIIIDKTLIDIDHNRKDINIYEVIATKIAHEENVGGLSNIILLGKLIKETNISSIEVAEKAIENSVSNKKAHMLKLNKKALRVGYSI